MRNAMQANLQPHRMEPQRDSVQQNPAGFTQTKGAIDEQSMGLDNKWPVSAYGETAQSAVRYLFDGRMDFEDAPI